MTIRNIKKKYLVIGAVVIIIGGYYWYNNSKSVSTAVQYKTAAAEKGTIITSISGSGNIVVDQSSTIDPTITGTVANLAVNVGDKVAKGQFLFNIVNDDLNVSVARAISSLQSSQNSLESAKLQIEQAKADYNAAKKDDTSTHDEKDILKDKIDIAENGVVAAQKSLAATQADYNNQIATAAKRKVFATISGTVNAVNIKNGDDLSRVSGSSSNAQAPIIIGDLGTLKAQAEINEVDIINVAIGQKVTLTFSAIDGLSVTGKIEKMDSLGTLTSGVVSYNVTIGFDSLDSRIKPGMSVSAAIITGVKSDVIVVPNSAVKTQNGNTYVQILSGQTPENKNVEIGLSNDADTEIISGINVGDNVVKQTIDPNAKTATTSAGGLFGGGGNRGGGLGALH